MHWLEAIYRRLKKHRSLLEIFFGFLIAGFVVARYSNSKEDPGDYGLGDKTSSYQAKDRAYLTHVIKNCDEEENSLLEGWEARGKRPVCLILGYSQAHAINDMKTGDVTYSQILFDRHKLDSPPIDVICQSLPNANMSEYYALFAYWSKKLPVKALVFPACMDKMRNDGLRQDYLQNLGFQDFQITDASDPLTQTLNRALAAFPKRIEAVGSNRKEEVDNAALKETVQEKVEQFLNGWLNARLPAWSRRANARGEVFLWLYLCRNSVLGISSNTKRTVIPARYIQNMRALENIHSKAERDNVKVLVYIPPVRSDLATPYNDQEYARYKCDVEASVKKHASVSRYLNMESIVPGPYWGDLPPTDLSGRRQPDFMHFKFEGHKITADALDPIIADLVRR